MHLSLVPLVSAAQGREPIRFTTPMNLGGEGEAYQPQGHPVVVTFWGTYCPPCRDEFPILVKGQQRYAAAGLRLLGLPTTVFIDTSGVIRGIHRGPIDTAALDSGVAAIFPSPPKRDPQDG